MESKNKRHHLTNSRDQTPRETSPVCRRGGKTEPRSRARTPWAPRRDARDAHVAACRGVPQAVRIPPAVAPCAAQQLRGCFLTSSSVCGRQSCRSDLGRLGGQPAVQARFSAPKVRGAGQQEARVDTATYGAVIGDGSPPLPGSSPSCCGWRRTEVHSCTGSDRPSSETEAALSRWTIHATAVTELHHFYDNVDIENKTNSTNRIFFSVTKRSGKFRLTYKSKILKNTYGDCMKEI